MKKITLKHNKFYLFILCFTGINMFGQCPENITVNSTEGQCGAVVSYTVAGGGDGGWSENGIINGNAEDGLDGWTLDQNAGSGWAVDSGYFVTSYSMCSKSQVIDLSDLGLSDEYMDTEPEISISDDYIGWTVNFADTYFLTVELRGESDNVIATYTTGNITTGSELETASHIFTDYGPGVRKVYFSHGGQDVEYWLGTYGAAMTNSQVKVALPAGGEVVQTEGLPSGSTFPVGTTINTFEVEDDQGDITICSFDIVVTDAEGPNVTFNDNITIALDENGTGSLTVEAVNNGSTDNCEIDAYELSKTEFTCEDAGENTVIFTVTDIHGNSSTANVAIMVVDETAPVAIAQNITVQLGEGGLLEITPQQIDNGSTDNCNIAVFSLDKETFTCEDLGENEVIFTIEDDHGNTDSQTIIVTVEDPENYCNAAGLIDFQSESIVIYPNPTSGNFEISGLPDGYDKIEFYDAVGKLVKITTGEENDLSALETGIYFAKIFSKDRVLIKEIVKK